jgi:hypothetical protein
MAKLWLLIVTVATSATVASSAAPPAAVPYPDGYRRWVHVSSQLIGPGSPMHATLGGLHHVYANDKAMAGLATGRYADGASFVFDVLNVETTRDVTSETTRRLIDVMLKDSTRFAATGGWGYEEFRGDGRDPVLEPARRAQCASCHATRQAQGHVFSKFRN